MVTLKIQESFTIQRDTFSKCQIYNKWTVHEYKCLFLTFVFLQIERERVREWYMKFGYKGEIAPKLLILFPTGFHWRIFLLSRANRLYSIFLHWLEEPGVPRVSDIILSSTRNTGFDPSARYEPCQTTDFLIIYFRWGEGVSTSVSGSQPIIGFSLLPLGVRRPEVTKYQHLLISPLWPTFFLNGHFLEGLPLFIPTGG